MSAAELFDPKCERAMLATAWVASDRMMFRTLESEDFVDQFHRWLFKHLRGLVEDGHPLDMVALLRRLKRPHACDECGVAARDDVDQLSVIKAMLYEILHEECAFPTHLPYYFETLRFERMRRAIVRISQRAIERASVEYHDSVAIASWAIANFESVLTKTPARRAMDVAFDANGDEAPDAAEAKAQPAIASADRTTAAAR